MYGQRTALLRCTRHWLTGPQRLYAYSLNMVRMWRRRTTMAEFRIRRCLGRGATRPASWNYWIKFRRKVVRRKVVLLSTVQLLITVNDQAVGQGTYDVCQVVQFSAVQISQTLIRVAIYRCPDRLTPANSPSVDFPDFVRTMDELNNTWWYLTTLFIHTYSMIYTLLTYFTCAISNNFLDWKSCHRICSSASNRAMYCI